MTTTPEQLAAKFERLGRDLTTRIPAAGLASSAAIAAAALRAGADRGAPPGGSQIKIKSPRGRGVDASITIIGYGFAVLTEYGSYKHPDGWAIYPRGLTKSGSISAAKARSRGKSLRGVDRKALAASRRLGYSKIMLGGGPGSDFAAAYVTDHPPIHAKPYQHAAAAASSPAAGRAYDKIVLGSLASIF